MSFLGSPALRTTFPGWPKAEELVSQKKWALLSTILTSLVIALAGVIFGIKTGKTSADSISIGVACFVGSFTLISIALEKFTSLLKDDPSTQPQ